MRNTEEREKFRVNLSNELNKMGIINKELFSLPSCVNQKQPQIDFFINSPIRAILEFYVSSDKVGYSIPPKIQEGIKNELIESISCFNPPAPVFVITNLNDLDWLQKLEINLIVLDKNQQDPHIWCANKIKEMIMERSYITPRSFKNKKISNGRFSDILISLSAILPEENFHKIITEIDNLEIEINASHFTAAAMRVGRTIEYSLYVCAKSWDVSINNITTRKLELFDKNYEMFKSAFIENTYSDSENSKSKKKLITAIKKLNNNLQDLSFEIDVKDEPINSDIPINIQTLLRDIRKKYIRHKEITNELDLILKEDYLKNIINVRNSAAHARTSLQNHEISEVEIKNITEDLRSILFRLVNIATLIKCSSPQ